jgi:hypothetical protein
MSATMARRRAACRTVILLSIDHVFVGGRIYRALLGRKADLDFTIGTWPMSGFICDATAPGIRHWTLGLAVHGPEDFSAMAWVAPDGRKWLRVSGYDASGPDAVIESLALQPAFRRYKIDAAGQMFVRADDIVSASIWEAW